MAKANYLLLGSNKVISLEDLYEAIASKCGLEKLDPTQPLPTGYTIIDISELTRTGLLRRVKIKLAANNIRLIYMTPASFSNLEKLVGLNYAGLTIKKAYFAGTSLN